MIDAIQNAWSTFRDNLFVRRAERKDTRSPFETIYRGGKSLYVPKIQPSLYVPKIQPMTDYVRHSKCFSFSPAGRWSAAQVPHVLEILQPEAEAMGLRLRAIEITNYSDVGRWYMIGVLCAVHELPLSPNSACPECLKRI